MTGLEIGDLILAAYLGIIVNITRNPYSDDFYYDVEWFIPDSTDEYAHKVYDIPEHQIARFRENFLKSYGRLLRKPSCVTM